MDLPGLRMYKELRKRRTEYDIKQNMLQVVFPCTRAYSLCQGSIISWLSSKKHETGNCEYGNGFKRRTLVVLYV
jgi:hypothetical protein